MAAGSWPIRLDSAQEKSCNPCGYILTDSRLCLNIYVWGLPFVFYYNVATGIWMA